MTYTVIFILIMLSNGIESKIKNQPLSCKPNSYIFLGCNVCRCDAEGRINQQFCTQRKCSDTRRSYNVDGSCQPGNWYSSEPCQICYCLFKNKLVCNSVANQDKLQLGTFAFSICGNNYLDAASGLYKNIPIHRKKKNIFKSVPKKTTTPEPDLNTDEMLLDLLESKRKVNDNSLFYKIHDMRESKRALALLKDRLLQEHILESKISQRHNDESSLSLGALRRGKVRLMKKETCTPGESLTKNCESCYCLQSGKMLCVQRNCVETN